MKTRIGFMVVGSVGLMLMAAMGECRDFDGRQSLSLVKPTGWDYQRDIALRLAGSKVFGADWPADKEATPEPMQSKPRQRAFDLCLSRCAAPADAWAPRRAGQSPGNDLNDAALAERLRKIGVGLSWKATPSVGISADYEKVMDAADVGRVAPDTVRARMQWDF